MGLRRGLELSEKFSYPVTTEMNIDVPLATLRERYVTMLRIRKFEK
jgi:hypothetical protein